MRKIRIAAWNILGPKGGKNGIMTQDDPVSTNKIRSLVQLERPDFAFFQEVPPLKYMTGLDRRFFTAQISSRTENYCRGIMTYQAVPDYQAEIVSGNGRFPAAAGYIVRSSGGDELFRFLGVWNSPYQPTGQESYYDNFVGIVEGFRSFCAGAKNLIIAGDTNLILGAEAYRNDPVKQEACLEMRQKLADKLASLGLPAVYPTADGADTLKWHDRWYRCDLLCVSETLRDGLCAGLGSRAVYIDELESDHLPIFAEFYL